MHKMHVRLMQGTRQVVAGSGLSVCLSSREPQDRRSATQNRTAQWTRSTGCWKVYSDKPKMPPQCLSGPAVNLCAVSMSKKSWWLFLASISTSPKFPHHRQTPQSGAPVPALECRFWTWGQLVGCKATRTGRNLQAVRACRRVCLLNQNLRRGCLNKSVSLVGRAF